jgi:hypothetical protein
MAVEHHQRLTLFEISSDLETRSEVCGATMIKTCGHARRSTEKQL